MEEKIVCSVCGKEFDIWDKQEDFRIKQRCGYGTKYDCSDIDLRLCCECMENLIDGCKINPVISHNLEYIYD